MKDFNVNDLNIDDLLGNEPDDNVNNSKNEFNTLEKRLADERGEWTNKVAKINSMINKLHNIPDLMLILYTERQRAVEYYHYLLTLLSSLDKRYRKLYAERQDFYQNKVQIRFPNESVKHNKILVDLEKYVIEREYIQIHSKFINSTISTLDNIIYAIPKRIELASLVNGK